MIRNSYKARAIFNSITAKVSELRSFDVRKEAWEKSFPVCKCLEPAASLTEYQFGLAYSIFSMTNKPLEFILYKCARAIKSFDPVLQAVAIEISAKLKNMNQLCAESG